jgi:pyruvate dehydrogenase phosphatase
VDDFLILGTDGLWDFVTSQEAVNIVGKVLRHDPGGNSEKASEALQTLVLSRAAERCGVDLEQLKRFHPGKERRRRFDDTTIIVVDLKRAFEFFWWG